MKEIGKDINKLKSIVVGKIRSIAVVNEEDVEIVKVAFDLSSHY